ncbi:MAG: SDR family NAD(P)-dependent oxidoreductase, partial [Mesorhizobium sp.]
MPTKSARMTDSATPMKSAPRTKSTSEQAASKQRSVQRKVDATDRAKSNGKSKPQGAMQAGAREYPVPPFPKQHHPKPGEEWAIEPAPLYDAPFWQGSNKLEGKVALITGGDSGIGRAVAVLFAREGADIAIAYLSEDRDAKATKQAVEAEGRRCIIMRGDVARRTFCHKAVERTLKAFGRLDVLVNNAAFQ